MTDEFHPTVSSHTDPEGRRFDFVHVTHPGATDLVVHFSAFFGKWGDAKPYRDQFQGYFHRLKMLGSDPTHNWLFLCDPYGAFHNGTYYLGERGDLFVERATRTILDEVTDATGVAAHDTIMMGSSMGGTAALGFGLERRVRGIVAIGPHIDLDLCAALQNRHEEVAFTVPDGDPSAPANFPLTRRIRARLADYPDDEPLPRLFVQSCADDAGVHDEQVVPLVEAWRARGGAVDLDVRPHGGHTSDWATRALLLDVVDQIEADRPVPAGALPDRAAVPGPRGQAPVAAPTALDGEPGPQAAAAPLSGGPPGPARPVSARRGPARCGWCGPRCAGRDRPTGGAGRRTRTGASRARRSRRRRSRT